MKYPDAKLIIFARAPIPGEVKTRLIPALGKNGATQFYQRMAQHVIGSLLDSQLCDVSIDCMPDSSHAFFLNILEQRCVELNKQTGSNLGERMAHAIGHALNSYRYAILIGTDAPCLSPEHIEHAIDALKSGSDVVIGPAEDGGFVLIGMRRLHRELFSDIDWGTAGVLKQTLDKARQSKLSVFQMPVLWDVDTPDDLDKVRLDGQLNYLLDGV